MLENSKEAYNTLKALTKTQQHQSAAIDNNSGNILTEITTVLNRWTEYCSGLYNYELHPDTRLLQSNQTPTQEAENLSVMREEFEEAVHSLKAGKSPGANNIPFKLLKNGGKATTTVLRAICKKIWETKKWSKEWTQSLIIHLPPQLTSSNVRTILNKIMLRVILSRPKAKAEELLAEDQTGF